jgi:predicted dehydrogenase
MQEKLPCPVFASTGELYDKGIDAVSICTPDHLHKDAVLEAFSRNVKVLVEKPLAVDYPSARIMLDARPDISYLTVGHDLHYDPRVIAAKRDIQAGKLGNIMYIRTRRTSSIPTGKRIGGRTSVTWFLGIHDMELVLWLTGLRVFKVDSAVGIKAFSSHWDCVNALITMENGAKMNLSTHWLFPGVHSQEGDSVIQIFGNKGISEINLLKNEYSFTPAEEGRQKFSDVHYQPDDYYGVPAGDLRYEVEDFFTRSVMENECPSISCDDAIAAVKAIEDIENILES